MKLVIQQLVVRASAERVFELFTDPVQFGQWMAEDAVLDAIAGGVVRWTHPNGDTVSGRYVEVERPRRIVFTYGWERADVGIPPGSTTVEVDLISQSDGSTLVKLVHRGLEGGAADAHHGGWVHYLDRLRRTAEGEDVGKDPWADRRVPSRQELHR
ncbi:ATPase [Mycobacterium sp. IS-836]|uniref:SRPBCC family protein n=1 Tax=Mycobacterium sp. IS-836 TaxID=1834160 RepID=UPI00096CA0F5|nr:SRPBCC family protein [Mycobacterium sp. IS-836]OMC57812.1 ATPase [Mycobacterium sp. IS-836]